MGKRRMDSDVYEWRPRIILIPRIGMLITRSGSRTRVIWPGRYLVRRSRSLGQTMYRLPPR